MNRLCLLITPFFLLVIFSLNIEARQYGNLVFDEAHPAFWLFPPDVSGEEYGVFHYRKSFSLNEIPEEFIVHVSADNRYRLFVNGEMVSSGSQRSDLMHWRYETVDIAPYLQKENVIAAVVWNWGAHKPVAQFSLRTAFLMQGNSPFEAELINTDKSWTVIQNKAYVPVPVRNGMVSGYYAAPPGESVDGNKYPWGWEALDFDDESWNEPETHEGWGADITQMRGAMPTGEGNKWQLVPRTIPQMDEHPVYFESVRRSGGMEITNKFLSDHKAIKIPPSKKVSFILDQGHLTNAYPIVKVSGGTGSRITLLYAEAPVDSNGNKGNRNELEGKAIRGVQDVILPDGGENRTYQGLWFKTYRYVKVEIETAGEELILHDIHGLFTGFPYELQASFQSDEEWLGDMWDINWRVLRLCAWETFFDTPYYEQLQYLGDTRIQALTNMHMSDDDRLVRQAITHFNLSRIPEGITGSRYPSDMSQYIPTFSLIWVAMVHDFWMYRDDEAFVKSMLPGIRGVLQWYDSHIDETGLVGPLPWWPFIDWANGWNLGRPPQAKTGHSVMISLQYVYALQRAAELEEHLGNSDQAKQYLEQAKTIIEVVQTQAWDEDRKLYKDALEGSEFSQQTNTIAVLTDAIDEEDKAEFMKRILNEEGLTQATYYYSFYVLEALRKAGLSNEYIKQLGPWQKMLADGLTTTAERPDPTRSDSHAWSAHPNYGLLATVLGIRPLEPGFKSVVIQPALGDLDYAKGTMPHPNGLIEVSVKRISEAGIEAEVTLPEGLTGEFLWNDKKVILKAGKQTFSL